MMDNDNNSKVGHDDEKEAIIEQHQQPQHKAQVAQLGTDHSIKAMCHWLWKGCSITEWLLQMLIANCCQQPCEWWLVTAAWTGVRWKTSGNGWWLQHPWQQHCFCTGKQWQWFFHRWSSDSQGNMVTMNANSKCYSMPVMRRKTQKPEAINWWQWWQQQQ